MSRLLGGGLLALCALALYITGRSEQAPRIVSISSPVGSGMGGRWPHGGGAPKPVDGFDINNPAELLAHAVLPVNIVANAMRNQRTAAASKPAPKPCPADCVKNGGVCNPGLGECSCPPFMGGASCGAPLLSECAALVGMVQTAAAPVASPCLIDGRSRAPVSCECLRACESLGVMGNRACYVMNAANESLMRWVQQQRNQRGLEANSEYFAATLAPLAGQSKERCSGHGVWAPAGGMPAKGVPAGKCEKKGSCRCLCYPGYDGDACERSTAVVPRHFCLNGCSGRGECFRNWCRCEPGFYGIDCSLGAAPKGASPPPPLPPPIGAQDGKWAAGAPKLYVYELPGRFGSWLQAGSHGWWQDMDLWGEDVVIHRRALRSAYRVLDPEQADYFLVHVSSGMWQLNWGFRDLLPTGVRVHEAALQYIKESYPFWSRKGGADHLWVFGHDQGAWRIRAKLPELEASIFINVFGAAEAQRGGHRHGHDIVCPPVLYSGVPAGLLNHHGRQRIANPPLAFFQGKLNLHIPYEYSFGIRQGLYKAHRTSGAILVREGHEANRERYFELMSASKFCVAAAGFGFSTRVYESAAAGCVPLIMMDGVESAYEELLPYSSFALRMNDSLRQIATLEPLLRAVPAARVAAMRAELRCLWPRLLWLRHDGTATPLPEQDRLLKYDAFESLFWTLRKRLRGDIQTPPDREEACAAVRDYFKRSARGWGPWANWADLPAW